MNKEQFLAELRKHLAELPREEIKDILQDQTEYIHEAMLAGRSEPDIIQSLGNPKQFAQSLLIDTKIQQAREEKHLGISVLNIMPVIRTVVKITPISLIFILIPLFIIILFTVFLWLGALGLMLASLAGMFIFFLKLVTLNVGFSTHVATFFMLLGLIGLGLLAVTIAYKITRFCLEITINYINWQVGFIQAHARRS